MGFGGYFDDVRTARASVGSQRQSEQAFIYSQQADLGLVKSVHPDLNILQKIRECCDSNEHPQTTPIAVAMDVSSSRGKDAKTIFEQVPSFLGSLKITDIVPDPQILWAAFGDANTDKAPIQIGQFESDKRIDSYLSKIWLEEGGGGTGEESSELTAYYLAHKTKLDCRKRGKKGYAFFMTDEAPYATVSRQFVKSYIGDDIKKDVPSKQVFSDLQAKFHTFVIFPRSSMEARKASIDSEIRQRLERLGGRFEDVDIRATLIWHSRDDLDLHCLTPRGQEISYSAKRANCGGELDVDRNVRGEDPKPVENIRWAKGDAQTGRYRFWVELYDYHELYAKNVPFKVELDVNGEIQTFEGHIAANKLHKQGMVVAFEFDYTAGAGLRQKKSNHDEYRDEVIPGKWERYLPSPNILRVQHPESCVEVMLGAMALQSGKMTLQEFVADMKVRKVSAERREDVRTALLGFSQQGVLAQVGDDLFA